MLDTDECSLRAFVAFFFFFLLQISVVELNNGVCKGKKKRKKGKKSEARREWKKPGEKL